MKLGKHFVLIYSPCFIDLGVVQLCLFVSLCKLLHMKTKGSMYCTNSKYAEVKFQKKLCISITTYMISSANIDSVT